MGTAKREVGDAGTYMGDTQVGKGPSAMDKLETRVSGESGDRYITIRNRA